MLLRLAGDEEEAAEAFVRRRVPLDELELERDPDAARALAVLTESRLLTVDEGAVEVAHEALLREWPRLRGWLEDDAEGRRLHQHLIGAAREWRDSERDPAELYRGARLAAALDWAAEHDPELNELERAFLDESRAASEREAERQRRADRRLRTLLAGVGVLLAAAVVAGVIALSERQGARSAATVADAERLGAQALTEERLDRALRLAERRRRPRRLGRHPLQPPIDAASQPRGDRRPQPWRRRALRARAQPRRGNPRGQRRRRHRDPVRHRDPGGSRRSSGARTDLRPRLRSAGRLARPRLDPARTVGADLGNGIAGDSRRGYRAGAQLDLAWPLSRSGRPRARVLRRRRLRSGRTKLDRHLHPR